MSKQTSCFVQCRFVPGVEVMGSGVSTEGSSSIGGAALPLEVSDLDAPHVTVDDICAWLEAQSAASPAEKTLEQDLCASIRSSGASFLTQRCATDTLIWFNA